MAVTIRDVSRHPGVALGTVPRVVNHQLDVNAKLRNACGVREIGRQLAKIDVAKIKSKRRHGPELMLSSALVRRGNLQAVVTGCSTVSELLVLGLHDLRVGYRPASQNTEDADIV
jgi:hypothetical protein